MMYIYDKIKIEEIDQDLKKIQSKFFRWRNVQSDQAAISRLGEIGENLTIMRGQLLTLKNEAE